MRLQHGESPPSASVQNQLHWQRTILFCMYEYVIDLPNCVFDLFCISDTPRYILTVCVMACMSFNSVISSRRVQYHPFLVSKMLHVRNAYSVMVRFAAAHTQKDPAFWNLCDELMLASNSDHLKWSNCIR